MRTTTLQSALSRNNLYLLLVLMFSLGFKPLLRAQTANEVFDAYKQVALNIQNLSYKVNQVDTFLSGDIRSITGSCLISRQTEDKLIGCSFAGKRLDLPVTHWYDGKDFYTINDEEKSYSINHTPGKVILGSVGGQMLCTEFFQPDNDFTKLSLTVLPDFYVLRMEFPDQKKYGVFNRYKLLYLDKNTLLLKKIEAFQQTPDKQQSTVRLFTDVYVNDPLTALDLNKKDNIKFYKLQELEQKNNELTPPIKKKRRNKA
jgi:hypothetical protein